MLANNSSVETRGKSVGDEAGPIERPQADSSSKREHSPRVDRKSQFGIDCVDFVHFSHWEPGGEYVKNITVKNVVMKTQKIRYKLPQTRYFSMEFPETKTLSAGMKWTIPVTFRPVAKERYDDLIEFSTSFGEFCLPVRATLPEHVMEFPDSIDFGFCPINETAKFNFQLHNVGELSSYFEWGIQHPFHITPENGHLEPGKSCFIQVEFKPKEACVYDAVAICTFGIKENWEKSKVVKSAKIFGIAKYSHLIVGEKMFDFGNVPVGTTSEKVITLKNPSSVHANFKIKRGERDTSNCYDFSTISGRVEKGSSFDIKIKCNPVASGLQSTSYFDITTLSGNSTRITASSCGVGPKVSLEPNLLNFNDIPAGSSVIRTFSMKNESNIPTSFQFLIEKNSTFKVDKLYGTIGPNSVISLQVKLCPNEPINYYRRVYCLVENQDAIYIDFLGTCFTDKRRPATFDPKQVFNYQKRVLNGLVEYGPEHLEELLKSGILRCRDGILEFVDAAIAKENAMPPKKDKPGKTGDITSEYFYSNSGALACSLLDTYVDFGSCSRYRVIEPKIIRVANHTKGKMTCVWMEEEDNGEALFNVSPRTADIPPKSIYEFRVQFRPKVDSEFYGKQLECFCYFKSMRNFRLVNEDTFTPPWCLTPEVAGNTFPPGEDTFIPKTNFGRSSVVFPPCYIDMAEYQTFRISNAGDTTVKFSFVDNTNSLGIGGDTETSLAGGPAFSVKPRVGVLKKNESRLVALRFSPGENRLYEEAFTCYFNSSSHTKYDLNVTGFGAFPEITFENNNTLNFKPTCVGSLASRTFTIRNKSKASLFFEWQIPKQFLNVISITPLSGFLKADQLMNLQATFVPPASNPYSLSIPCFYYPDENRSERQRTSLFVHGIGVYGRLTVSPEQLDFTNVLVNTAIEREITFFNPSECDVAFTVGIKKIKQRKENGDVEYEELANSLKESQIQVYQKSKVLPARSNETIKIKACLKDEEFHEFIVFYKTDKVLIANENGIQLPKDVKTTDEHFLLTTIKAKGVHPIMAVTDIRSDGLSKTILWQQFSLDRFNRLLQESTDDPLAYAEQIAEDDSFPTDSPVVDVSPLDADINFDFGATSVGLDPTLLKISLKNSGVVPVDWSFNYPNDSEVEIEGWADPGDINEEQLTRNFILDNNIFEISPKSGNLQPGKDVTILMTYSHEYAGPHRLPVRFRLRNGLSRSGKEILINFIGYSVPVTQKFLHLQSINYEFEPVLIGTESPPVQYYRMMNRGTAALDYTVDTSPIAKLNEENMNFNILTCVKTKGTIQPGEMDFLEFIFCPLEEKIYEVDIPITVDGGRKRMVTLRGQGFEELDAKFFGAKKEPNHSNHIIPETITPIPLIITPIARISTESIAFGHVPICTTLRQIVVVSNTNQYNDVSVNWKIPEVWPKKSIRIFPESKSLLPGESQVFKIIFIPDDTPRLYNFDLECIVVDETAKAKYMLENKNESGVSESLDETAPGTATAAESHSSLPHASNSALNARNSASSTKSINKFKKLPAIASPMAKEKTITDMIQDELKSIESKEPAPLVYYVGLKAQSHHSGEFKKVFKRYSSFFREKRTGFSTSYPSFSESPSLLDEGAIVHEIMNDMLNDLFLDKSIQILPEELAKEPIPFFKEQVNLELESLQDGGPKKTEIMGSADFMNAIEAAFEGTIYNLMQEINQDEFEPTTYPMLVSSSEMLKK